MRTGHGVSHTKLTFRISEPSSFSRRHGWVSIRKSKPYVSRYLNIGKKLYFQEVSKLKATGQTLWHEAVIFKCIVWHTGNSRCCASGNGPGQWSSVVTILSFYSPMKLGGYIASLKTCLIVTSRKEDAADIHRVETKDAPGYLTMNRTPFYSEEWPIPKSQQCQSWMLYLYNAILYWRIEWLVLIFNLTRSKITQETNFWAYLWKIV